ncbi:MAG: Endolytic murein transglycosylase [Fimbriimonadaceae bacterium]|nr:Endolytic murein transglycosylase [Fimbriimonadaceae bacterium]
MPRRKRRNPFRRLAMFIAVLLALGAAGFVYLLQPTGATPKEWIRFDRSTPLDDALARLQTKGMVRHAGAAWLWARINRKADPVAEGTYLLAGGLAPLDLVQSLRKPIRQMVTLPEGWWIARTAKRIGEKNIDSADSYNRLANDPSHFQSELPVAEGLDSLEGLLYPDTYDLPPLLGAEGVIRRQLRTFKAKVGDDFFKKSNWREIVVIASMVEAETKLDEEKPVVAGVIANRIRARMRLQIDATVLYGLQEWKQLKPGEVRKVDSKYNTYLHDGLPPGPIGSPSISSIRAAENPARHEYLYYVAMPGGYHRFAKTYADHLKNIRVSRKAFAKGEKP